MFSIFKARLSTLLVAVLVMLLSGCTSIPEEIEPEFSPTYQSRNSDADSRQGSIFQAGNVLALFEDQKANRIGDILTVLLVEQTSGQNSSDNNVNQSTNMSLATPTFGGSSRPNMGVDLSSENSFIGASGSSQSNSLSGSIAVTVTEVLDNGNLIIEGEKWIRINQGNEYIRLQGVIRPKDIDTFNTLYSTQIADAHISYGGRGNNARGNVPGWAAKILFSPLWPF
ncbi:MAG: flagellar basal body L-ring protein [SAR86 cluster bacterium]|uniref:Flagellar L-ring protein n=1 Tax=SAR86 cluster bacterium TaxID=2030880 RepID=A0A2A5CAB4_9GAMM|nr:MAG: flagellar basal body L-ring protein [SAR86 cluster bacterium]